MSVVHNVAARRYELPVEGGVAFAAYRETPGGVIVHHTEVPSHLEGQGIGSRLVRGMLDDMRANGVKLAPACSFVRAYLRRHPEDADLVIG